MSNGVLCHSFLTYCSLEISVVSVQQQQQQQQLQERNIFKIFRTEVPHNKLRADDTYRAPVIGGIEKKLIISKCRESYK